MPIFGDEKTSFTRVHLSDQLFYTLEYGKEEYSRYDKRVPDHIVDKEINAAIIPSKLHNKKSFLMASHLVLGDFTSLCYACLANHRVYAS
jgi:hypothetical protein